MIHEVNILKMDKAITHVDGRRNLQQHFLRREKMKIWRRMAQQRTELDELRDKKEKLERLKVEIGKMEELGRLRSDHEKLDELRDKEEKLERLKVEMRKMEEELRETLVVILHVCTYSQLHTVICIMLDVIFFFLLCSLSPSS